MKKYSLIPELDKFIARFTSDDAARRRGILSLLGVMVVTILLLLGLSGCTEDLYEEEPTQVVVTERTEDPVSVIVVEIKGEVVRPGVYTIEADKRLNDLLNLAGGKTQAAELRHVNLAKKLKDGDSFYIPYIGEQNVPVQGDNSGIGGSGEEKRKIDINAATREELMTVPGIGPATADNILRYRESQGAFKTIEDLLEVDRIGDKTLEKLKEYLEVG